MPLDVEEEVEAVVNIAQGSKVSAPLSSFFSRVFGGTKQRNKGVFVREDINACDFTKFASWKF